MDVVTNIHPTASGSALPKPAMSLPTAKMNVSCKKGGLRTTRCLYSFFMAKLPYWSL